MKNKVLNKQISVEQIIKVADYLEDYKEKYDKIFELEENKNRDLKYSEKNYEYEYGNAKISYTIYYKDGRNITEKDYNWFVGSLNQVKAINKITFDLYISFNTKGPNDTNSNSVSNRVSLFIDFKENDVNISIDTTNQEREANNIYYDIMNILESNDNRYNKTIKYRKIRTQCFTISVGIILSWILFIALKINMDKIPSVLLQVYNNKYFLLLGQWFVAIVLGNITSFWFIMSIYRPLLPDARYAGWNSSSHRGIYKDDVNDYTEHSEIHIGNYFDAEKRRNKIEKIYKVTSKIVLVQLAISVALFFILK